MSRSQWHHTGTLENTLSYPDMHMHAEYEGTEK